MANNDKVLLEEIENIGFRKLEGREEYLFRGRHNKFTAKYHCDKIPFFSIYKISNKKDIRPNSKNKGRYYRIPLKDCSSIESIIKIIENNDLKPQAKIGDIITIIRDGGSNITKGREYKVMGTSYGWAGQAVSFLDDTGKLKTVNGAWWGFEVSE